MVGVDERSDLELGEVLEAASVAAAISAALRGDTSD